MKGKKTLGIPATNKGMDFIGKTSSTVAKLFSATGELGSLPETSSAGCSAEGSATLIEAGGEGGLSTTLPKQPSSSLVREEVSVPARAILILLRPHFS